MPILFYISQEKIISLNTSVVLPATVVNVVLTCVKVRNTMKVLCAGSERGRAHGPRSVIAIVLNVISVFIAN